MRSVIFVAPYFLDATLRFVDAVSRLDDVRLGLISTDPEEKLPAGLRSRAGTLPGSRSSPRPDCRSVR